MSLELSSTVVFDDLNDDINCEILKYMPIKELIRLELVSQRWREICGVACKGIHALACKGQYIGGCSKFCSCSKHEYFDYQKIGINDNVIGCKLLSKLTNLKALSWESDVPANFGTFLDQHCSNLEHLELFVYSLEYETVIDQSSFEFLTNLVNCSVVGQLKCLRLEVVVNEMEESLQQTLVDLVGRCSELKALWADIDASSSAMCLPNGFIEAIRTKRIEHLTVTGEAAEHEAMVQLFPSLKTFCPLVISNFDLNLMSTMSRLESVDFSLRESLVTHLELDAISKVMIQTKFRLKAVKFHRKNCSLQFSKLLVDYAPHLEHLSISWREGHPDSDQVFENISKLVKLRTIDVRAAGLTLNNMATVVTKCSKLRKIAFDVNYMARPEGLPKTSPLVWTHLMALARRHPKRKITACIRSKINPEEPLLLNLVNLSY